VNIVTVEDALDQFRALAGARKFDVSDEPSSMTSTGSTTTVRVGNAKLQLTCGGADGVLLLQISHGPTDGPPSGWLELFRSRCTSGSFRDADLAVAEVSFLSSVEYGLELMLPRGATEST
jgi:hypothetical protein